MVFDPQGQTNEVQVLLDRFAATDYGETVPYDQLDALLGRPLRDNREPYYRAQTLLETHHQKTTVAVPNVGYRVVNPNEHSALARGHLRRSRKQLTKAVRKTSSANRQRMAPHEASRVDTLEINLARLALHVEGESRRIDHLQTIVGEVTRRTETQEDHLNDVTNRLNHLEEQLRERGYGDVPPPITAEDV